jgi:AcrR family transcriptional regulator
MSSIPREEKLTTVVGNTAKRQKRYDRNFWLREALEVLAKEGGAKLRVDSLAKSLNVTKGSFYHHFRGRSDFVAALSDYWVSEFTDVVIQKASAMPGNGYEKLGEVMRLVEKHGLDKYDVAFRSWAAQDSSVAKIVRDVDLARYRFIRSLLEEMGFTGMDLEVRVRTWLVYASASRSVNFPAFPQSDQPGSNAVLEFFTRKQG